MRDGTSSRPCCAAFGSKDLKKFAKDYVKKLSLNESVRVNGSYCLNQCEKGPVMVIYPAGTWYTYSTEEDVKRIIDASIVNDTQLEDLLLNS